MLRVLGPYADRAGLLDCGEFNLGPKEDFRVPDGGWFDAPTPGVYAPTAVAVLEVLSLEDETFAKFSFYFARGVQEVLVADLTTRTITCWVRAGSQYVPSEQSDVFDATMAEIQNAVRWP